MAKFWKTSLLVAITLLREIISVQAAQPGHIEGSGKCTVLAQGYEEIDDSPAIQDALRACGAGGTIILPAGQNYSIRTPIDFSPCNHCDFQIEGTLIAGQEWDYWSSVDSVFTLANAHNVRIRSLTGSGVIDGNAISYYYGRCDSGTWYGKAFAHVTNGSSDIHFENLKMQNVMQRFFRLEGNSANLSFKDLRLSVQGQWGLYPRNEAETFGFEMGDVRNVSVESVDMDFRSRPEHGGTTGVCAAFDVGTFDVSLRDVSCKGAWGGALVMVGTIFPFLESKMTSNILVNNFTFNGDRATGFEDYWSDAVLSNITWNGVDVIAGSAVTIDVCYLRLHGTSEYRPNCIGWTPEVPGVNATLQNVWFKNYVGPVGSTPTGWASPNNRTIYDVHFADWVNTTTA